MRCIWFVDAGTGLASPQDFPEARRGVNKPSTLAPGGSWRRTADAPLTRKANHDAAMQATKSSALRRRATGGLASPQRSHSARPVPIYLGTRTGPASDSKIQEKLTRLPHHPPPSTIPFTISYKSNTEAPPGTYVRLNLLLVRGHACPVPLTVRGTQTLVRGTHVRGVGSTSAKALEQVAAYADERGGGGGPRQHGAREAEDHTAHHGPAHLFFIASLQACNCPSSAFSALENQRVFQGRCMGLKRESIKRSRARLSHKARLTS